MTPIEIVGGIFGLFAVGLIVLLIYKSTLRKWRNWQTHQT
jgi:hypothetical protein